MPRKSFTAACTMDCPDTCGLEVTVSDGKIQRIRGTQDHPTTNGFICDKVSHFARRVYHEDRLLYPMRRAGKKGEGTFTHISWDDAIAEITNRFKTIIQQWGGEAILPYHYGGSNGFLADSFIDDFYFATLGASRMAKTLCAAPSTAVARDMYGRMPGVAFEDYPHAKCIIIWGANPKATNIHLVPMLRQAKKNGAFIAVVNPIKTFSDHEIDLHLPVYPGADLPVALAMIRLWHEAERFDLEFLRQHADGSNHSYSKHKYGQSNVQQQKLVFLPNRFVPWHTCMPNRLRLCSALAGERNVIATVDRHSPRFSPCPHCSGSLVCAVVAIP